MTVCNLALNFCLTFSPKFENSTDQLPYILTLYSKIYVKVQFMVVVVELLMICRTFFFAFFVLTSMIFYRAIS